MARAFEGARALLFERLVDLDPQAPTEPKPLRTLNRRELRESVRRELEWLLNTRCPIPAPLLDERERTVINYGIPDLSWFYPQNPRDQRRLASILSQTISAFEPRLRQVRVTVERYLDVQQALYVIVDALLVIESITEPVSFPVVIYSKRGGSEVHASQ